MCVSIVNISGYVFQSMCIFLCLCAYTRTVGVHCVNRHTTSVCVCVCVLVRIQADYRGEIRSLRHTHPVFYSGKTGGYMSEQDGKNAPCNKKKKKKGVRSVSAAMGRAC